MWKQFDKPYNPKKVEHKIYQLWEKSGYFNPDKLPGKRKKSFTITVPPPNVTGSLHLGHALNATIQDILIRKKRMEGYRALWLSGTDHAGIATQNVVEKDLRKQGISRHDLGREKFLEKIWQWKEKYGHIILDQFKKLGSSMDWSRTRFTMDVDYQEAVKEAFLEYYKNGWIYQAERVINWCIRCGTSLSDLEVEFKDAKSKLWFIKYSPDITVATTRPETMLGDTAVAVHPNDKRYKNLIGQTVVLPIQNRKIPIIADKRVDPKFGTGAVKVTPGHSFTDFEIGQEHNLEIIKIIGQDGKMTERAGKDFEGLTILQVREKVLQELEKQGLIKKVEDYNNYIGHCYRCGTIIEPIPSLQWFLKMDELAKMAVKAVKSGKIKFHPKRWEKVYFDWLRNVKDWCISRQIWWGHKIPLAKCTSCNEFLTEPKIKSRWFLVRHGETEWNKEGRVQGYLEVPLNENGRKQVRATAQHLKDKNIDLIISSDLARCRETAAILKKELAIKEIIFDKNLRERHLGEWQGLTREEIKERYSLEKWDSRMHYEFKPAGGENWGDLENRVWEVFKNHKEIHRHKNIVIVTHGGPIRMIRKNIKNISWEDARQYPTPQNAEIIELIISKEKCKKCGGDILEPINDVLDTWFSSALWPFATLGWPEQTKDFKIFYPTQVLSTARDIINLWVTRMIFSGLEFLKKEPFKDVIIHATILTKEGKRMSKSLGTGVNPIDLISKYGADATRFGLIWQAMGNQDIHWSEEHVIAGKKFANKIWNATRFVLMNKPPRIDADLKIFRSGLTRIKNLTPADKKMLAQLAKTKKAIEKDLDSFRFGQALHKLYDFFWHDFCDVYIETSKKQMTDSKLKNSTAEILYYILLNSLKLLHPFMPFITEEIYQQLPIENKKLLMIESW